MKRLFILLANGAVLLPSTHLVHAQVSEQTATIFFNEACQDCGELVKEMYPMLFGEYGYTLELHDYINERSNRALLTQANDTWGVPFELQSHIETFVSDRLLIGGHVPETIIRYLIENPDTYDRLLVYQDAMHGEETEYRVWDFEGDIMTYVIDEPITTFLEEEPPDSTTDIPRQGFWGLFALITSSAFLDGLNPCAFAVLLFFISFLFTMKKTRASIWKMGLVYIAAIYLAYLLIGLGIAQAIIISGSAHLMAEIGAYLVIVLGIIQLAGVLFPAFPIHLRIPVDTKATLEKWMYKATLPASFIGGFLVGLCTFPCSGGIYVAIIGMLSAQSSLVEGTSWMLWYNLVFVSPLLILLMLASNPKATEHLQKLERTEARNTKLLIGGFMIALGAIILVFFT
jgi:cytochrome c biogenesis protein CcdA